MGKSDEYSTAKDSAYVEYMVDSLPKLEKINRPISAAQALYDKRNNSSEDYEAYQDYLKRPMVTKAQAQVLDSSGGVIIGNRALTPEEITNYRSLREKSKNTRGDAWDAGDKKVNEEYINKAISAFTCSPPVGKTEAEITKAIKLSGYTPPIVIEEPKETILERFFKKLNGCQVKEEIKPKQRLAKKGWFWGMEDK